MSTITKPKFPRLTAEQKRLLRVAVAKDVIKSLPLLYVTQGAWIAPKVNMATIYALPSKKAAQAIKLNCRVCGIGACFLSLVALDNKFDFDTYFIGQDAMFDRLKQCFSSDQLLLIENAFEGGSGGLSNPGSAESALGISPDTFVKKAAKIARAVNFGKEHDSPTDCLRAIMQNIIINKGSFKP